MRDVILRFRGRVIFYVHLDDGLGAPGGNRWLYIRVWRLQIRVWAWTSYNSPKHERVQLAGLIKQQLWWDKTHRLYRDPLYAPFSIKWHGRCVFAFPFRQR